jgi:hypothetical protein
MKLFKKHPYKMPKKARYIEEEKIFSKPEKKGCSKRPKKHVI